MFLKEVLNLAAGSMIVFDKGYVDYVQYEVFSENSIWYVTRVKDNAIYEARIEFENPDSTDSGVLKNEEIFLSFGNKKELTHRSRRIAYWDNKNGHLFEFITNNFELPAEKNRTDL